jgi:hypothetical protein
VDVDVKPVTFKCAGGDLLVMRGDTQKHWHHRVPKEKYRRPRVNINFRYILPNREDSERGQKTYYKYMVHGDDVDPKGIMFKDVPVHGQKRPTASLTSMWSKVTSTKSDAQTAARTPELQQQTQPVQGAVTVSCAIAADQQQAGLVVVHSVTSTHEQTCANSALNVWICGSCTYTNGTSVCCEICGGNRIDNENTNIANGDQQPQATKKAEEIISKIAAEAQQMPKGTGKAEVEQTLKDVTWACDQCTFVNNHDHASCSICMFDRGDKRAKAEVKTVLPTGPVQQQHRKGLWACEKCTYANNANRDICEVCAHANPASASFGLDASSSSKKRQRLEDFFL